MKKINLTLIILMGFVLMACSTTPKTKNVTLVAEDIVWNTSLIEAQVGQEIQITLRNEGVLDHNFEVADLDINVLLSPGESQTLSFVISEAGTFDYICSVPGHEEAGMAGEFIVSE